MKFKISKMLILQKIYAFIKIQNCKVNDKLNAISKFKTVKI